MKDYCCISCLFVTANQLIIISVPLKMKRFFFICNFEEVNVVFSFLVSTSYKFWKQPAEVFYKKGVLRNFTKFTGKHLCQSLFYNKVAGLEALMLVWSVVLCRSYQIISVWNMNWRDKPLNGFCRFERCVNNYVTRFYFSKYHIFRNYTDSIHTQRAWMHLRCISETSHISSSQTS